MYLGRSGGISGGSEVDLGAFRVDWRRIDGRLEEDWGCSKWLKITKNNFLRFLAFYHLISSFQALSCVPDDTAHFSLSFGIKNSQFDFIWLGIDPFFDRCSIDVR